jgi:hypothetical protein
MMLNPAAYGGVVKQGKFIMKRKRANFDVN